jgi:acetate---CoA ligase (ADP-forming)
MTGGDAPGLATPARMRSLFGARTVALVGASDRSVWAATVAHNLRLNQPDHAVIAVHPKEDEVFGRPPARSLRELAGAVDLAYVLTGARAAPQVLDDAGRAGIRNAVVLATGFAETGDARAEAALAARAASRDVTMLGPNCLGFLNARTGVAPLGIRLAAPVPAGAVGAVLQSGAMAAAVIDFARARGIGLSVLATLGNEAVVTAADVIDYLIEDEHTRAIAVFLEGIRDGRRFAEVAVRALAAGKPVVVFKVGRSEQGRRNSLAHTGAIAGDDAVADAAFAQFGVVRTRSLEELIATAGLFAALPRLPRGRRMGVVSASGGACGIIADLAADEGIDLPDFTPATVGALAGLLPEQAAPCNPLDTTGFGMARARPDARSLVDDALEVVARDPGLDLVLNVFSPPKATGAGAARLDERLRLVAGLIRAAEIPIVQADMTCVDVDHSRDGLFAGLGLHVVGGIDLAMRAAGHLVRFAEARDRAPRREMPVAAHPVAGGPVTGTQHAWSEHQARLALSAAGVSFVPAELVTDEDAAVAAAARFQAPVAVKICSPDIIHKSEFGGVALGLSGSAAVRAGYRQVAAAAERVPGARVEGVLVSPMRPGGIELFLSVSVDPTFGPFLAAGIGGLWIEALADTRIGLLPVEESEVIGLFRSLRGHRLLAGARGTQPADLTAVARMAVRLSQFALAAGPALVVAELNPVLCAGDRTEALDALIITVDAGGGA